MSERPTTHQVWEHVAFAAASRSLCSRAQVGAAIVDTRGRIIATGYNGPPAGFQHFNQGCENWCPRAGSRKTEPPEGFKEIRTFNYPHRSGTYCAPNDPNPGCSEIPTEEVHLGVDEVLTNTEDGLAWLPREELFQGSPDYSDCPSLHAEANALMTSERVQREGGSLYVTTDVCYPCAKLIANSGLAKVYVSDDGGDTSHRNPSKSYEFLRDCGIEVIRDVS